MNNKFLLFILLIVGIVFIAGCTTPTQTGTTETCGNGVCGTGETTATCEADCPAPRTSSLTAAD